MKGRPWSDVERDLLKQFWGWGLVGSEIAARLQRTRPAVLRMARRLDLQRRESPPELAAGRRPYNRYGRPA